MSAHHVVRQPYMNAALVALCSLVLLWLYTSTLVHLHVSLNTHDTTTSGEQKARILFFISTHEEGVPLKQLRRQLNALYQPYHTFIYHVDSHSSKDYIDGVAKLLREFGEFGTPHSNCKLMEPTAMGWGGVNTVEKTIKAIIHGLRLTRHWSHFINLSGTDYPARSVRDLENFLVRSHNYEASFLSYGWFPPSLGLRLAYIHMVDEARKVVNTGKRRTEHTGVDLRKFEFERDYSELKKAWDIPLGFEPYKASAWMVLSRGFCEYLSDELVEFLPLLVYSATIAASDEFFFPTVFFNSPYRHTTPVGNVSKASLRLCGVKENDECGTNLRYIVFEPKKIHPKVLTHHDLANIMATEDAYFIRKVSLDKPESLRLIEELDQQSKHTYFLNTPTVKT